jgi:uncharacterized SAM-dependent methyltransferase
MESGLHAAVRLFNEGRFSEFQDALESMTSGTRAPSERQFYTLLNKLAEALLQLSDGDVDESAEILSASLRKLDEFLPRFRGLNTEALRDDFRRVLLELRDVKEGRRVEFAPSRLPRLRFLPE